LKYIFAYFIYRIEINAEFAQNHSAPTAAMAKNSPGTQVVFTYFHMCSIEFCVVNGQPVVCNALIFRLLLRSRKVWQWSGSAGHVFVRQRIWRCTMQH